MGKDKKTSKRVGKITSKQLKGSIDFGSPENKENKINNKDLPLWYCKVCNDFISENEIIKPEYDKKLKIAIRNRHEICEGIIDYDNSHKYMAQEYRLYKENLKDVGKIQLETARKLSHLRYNRDE